MSAAAANPRMAGLVAGAPFKELPMPFIDAADGTPLYYTDWGSGRPVVLIHGWPLNSDMWEYQAGFLVKNGFRVIAYDRRGFGRSGKPWAGYDYNTLAGDLQAIIEKLDLQGAALVGFSMGGGEVARYLSQFGAGRISHAVLASAVTPFLLQTSDHPDGVPQSVFDDFIEQLQADRPHFLGAFGKKFFGVGLVTSPVSAEILHWASFMALQAAPHATIECVRSFSATDFRPDMKAFTIPTLIVHGDGDQTVPIATAGQAAAKLVPHAVFRTYSGAPHALVVTEKDQFNADLLGFLRS
jgi:non-heme chloroperoxidase